MAAPGSSMDVAGNQEPDVFETAEDGFVEGPSSATADEAVYDDIDPSKVPDELDPKKSSLMYQSYETTKSREGLKQAKRGDAITIAGQEIDADKAFKKASRDAKKLMETTSVDFSGGYLGAQRFFVDQKEFGLAGEGEVESLEEKYNRLKLEITGFLGEVAAAEKAQSSDSVEDNTATVAMAADMRFLSQQLQQVKIDAIVGAGVSGVPTSYQSDLSNRLLGNINAMKGAAPAAVPAKDAVDANGQVVYELFYRPEETKISEIAKAGKLEERIARLEKALGNESLAPLAAELEQQDPSVHSALIALTDRVATLSQENTTDLTTRLTAVIQLAEKAEKSATGAAASVDSEYAEKVKELYEIGKKCDSMASAVPGVIDRLVSLKRLHEQGADFGRTLTQLESTQGQLETSVADEVTMLGKVEANLKENLVKLEANFSAVNTRIEALGK